MISRKWIGSLMGCLTAVRLLAGGSQDDNAFFPLHKQTPPSITDMVLIYQGGTQRPKWTPDEFAPYVSAIDPRDGKEKWLYDAFLFIEFQDGKGCAFEEGLKLTPADKNDWQQLLDKNFELGTGLPALEKVCAETESRIGK